MTAPAALPPEVRCNRAGRHRCGGCKGRWSVLFATFVNGKGWRWLCARCSDPAPADPRPRAFRGRYPIRAQRREGGV